jgi:hypothetical protein
MTHAEFRRLARVGAEARLVALEQERQAIMKAFPGIQPADGRRSRANGKIQRRRRRKMSFAERKAVSLRMRKRWAEWRNKKGQAAAA